MCGSPCWTGHCSITSYVDMSTSELVFSSLYCCYTGQGSVTSDVNTLPASTHCITNGQGSAAARNNIGQLMSTLLHYFELKLLHSGEIQPNPGPVSSESQGHASVLASDMPRGLKIGEWNVQSLYNKIKQMRHVLDACAQSESSELHSDNVRWKL